MAPPEEDLFDEEPPEIDPYEVLGLDKSATADHVKSAYRKAALKHHPDKAPEHMKTEAHSTFQAVAFAYAILSDPIRRKRYDTTGSTQESIVDSDGFSWSEFYSEQFKDAISVDAIEKFAQTYKASDEEKDDLLAAYEEAQGKMDTVYQVVMLSDPREDETRFREIIDKAIAGGDVKSYRAYTHETKKQREKRIKEYDEEGAEAMEYAEQLGVADKLFNRDKKPSGEDALKALIQKRQQGRGSFLDQLEAKYASKSKSKKRGKRSLQNDLDEEAEDGVNDEAGLEDEPSEEAFQAAAARLKKNAPATATRDDKASNRSKRAKTKR